MYTAKLHDGEVEIMIFAQEYEGEHLVVIDDGPARKTAVFLWIDFNRNDWDFDKSQSKQIVL